MPRTNKHTRLRRWITEALGKEIMTTSQIQSKISNRTYETCGRLSRVKHTPSTQRLSQVLNVNKEFVRVNKYNYPAEWRLRE